MKKLLLPLISLSVLFEFNGIAQTTLILQPSGTNAKESYISSCVPLGFDTSNYSTSDHLSVASWTDQGNASTARSLIQFDISTIPANATISSATLSLYYNPHPADGDAGQSTLSGSNAAWIQRITSNWNASKVTWDNQPPTTTQDEAVIPESVSDSESYPNLDVTALVQDMVNDSSQSFGFMLELQDESYYRALLFASSNYADSTKHPMLDICYTIDSAPPPVAFFQSSDSILCTNDCVVFTNQSANATSWQWLFPGATPDTSTAANPSICYFSPGNYNVTLIASNGNGSDTLNFNLCGSNSPKLCFDRNISRQYLVSLLRGILLVI